MKNKKSILPVKWPFLAVIFLMLSLKSVELRATVISANVTIDFSNCNHTFAGFGAASACSGDTILVSATPLNSSNVINYWEAVDGNFSIPFSTGTGSNLAVNGNIPYFSEFNFKSNVTSCTISTGYVQVNPSPSIDLGPDKIVCIGTVVTITNLSVVGVGGPYEYNWNSPLADSSNTFLVRSVPGYYLLSIIDKGTATECQTIRAIRLINHPQPQVNAGGKAVRCNSQTLTLNAQTVTANPGTPPYTYQWSPFVNISGQTSKNPIIGTASGTLQTYTVELTDSKGCKATSTVTVTVNPAFSVNIPFPDFSPTIKYADTVVCKFNKILLKNTVATTATGTPFASGNPYKFSWLPALSLNDSTLQVPTATPLSIAGILYKLRVIDANGCVARDSVKVSRSSLTMSFTPDANTISICSGTTTTLGVSAINGNLPFVWTAGPQLTKLTDTKYITDVLTATAKIMVTVQDAKGCTDKDSIQVDINPIPVPNVGDKTANLCVGISKNIDVSPLTSVTSSFSYIWSPNVNISNVNVAAPLFTPTAGEGSQLYTVSVTSSLGCTGSDIITVNTRPNPEAKIDPVAGKPLVNTPIEFTSASEGQSFSWSFQDYPDIKTGNTVTHQFDSLRTYLVGLKVTSNFGCIGNDSLSLEIVRLASGNIFIPTVFSPNSSNNKNKTFLVFGDKSEIVESEFKVYIFNVFGQKVFESASFRQMNEEGWNGENYMPGIYSYVVKVKFIDDQVFTKTGSVTLLK